MGGHIAVTTSVLCQVRCKNQSLPAQESLTIGSAASRSTCTYNFPQQALNSPSITLIQSNDNKDRSRWNYGSTLQEPLLDNPPFLRFDAIKGCQRHIAISTGPCGDQRHGFGTLA